MSNRNLKILAVSCWLLLGMCAAPSAFAQVIIDYQPIDGIPSLNATMTLILALVLAGVAYRMLRKQQSGTGLLLAVLAASAMLYASGGIRLVPEAQALPDCASAMTSGEGGLMCVEESGPVLNQSDRTHRLVYVGCGFLQVILHLPLVPEAHAQNVGECMTGTILRPGESCTVDVDEYNCDLINID